MRATNRLTGPRGPSKGIVTAKRRLMYKTHYARRGEKMTAERGLQITLTRWAMQPWPQL